MVSLLHLQAFQMYFSCWNAQHLTFAMSRRVHYRYHGCRAHVAAGVSLYMPPSRLISLRVCAHKPLH